MSPGRLLAGRWWPRQRGPFLVTADNRRLLACLAAALLVHALALYAGWRWLPVWPGDGLRVVGEVTWLREAPPAPAPAHEPAPSLPERPSPPPPGPRTPSASSSPAPLVVRLPAPAPPPFPLARPRPRPLASPALAPEASPVGGLAPEAVPSASPAPETSGENAPGAPGSPAGSPAPTTPSAPGTIQPVPSPGGQPPLGLATTAGVPSGWGWRNLPERAGSAQPWLLWAPSPQAGLLGPGHPGRVWLEAVIPAAGGAPVQVRLLEIEGTSDPQVRRRVEEAVLALVERSRWRAGRRAGQPADSKVSFSLELP